MFTKSPIEVQIDDEIVRLLEKLDKLDPKSEEYALLVERLTKLHKLKSEERPKQISPDTVLVVAANIFGILWLTRYERENPITSKALNFVKKP